MRSAFSISGERRCAFGGLGRYDLEAGARTRALEQCAVVFREAEARGNVGAFVDGALHGALLWGLQAAALRLRQLDAQVEAALRKMDGGAAGFEDMNSCLLYTSRPIPA